MKLATKAKKRIKAWCNDAGLISFGDRIPHDAFPISDGTEEDTAIVRELAHKDGDDYWVPGIRDDRDWNDRIKMFADACNEHKDDELMLVTVKDMDRFHEWITRQLKMRAET